MNCSAHSKLFSSIVLSICLITAPITTGGDDNTHYFIQHPVSQSVLLNSTFTLACRLRVGLFQKPLPGAPKPTVQWVRNKFGLGTTREDIQEAGMEDGLLGSRYDLPYNLNEGQYDLQVTNAKSMDEGQYVCQLRYNQNTYFSQTADVRVLVASESPTLVQTDVNNVEDMRLVGPQVSASAVEGTNLRLHCIAKNGKPGAKLHWSLNGSPLIIAYNDDGTKGKIASPIEGTVSIRSVSSPEPPFLVTTVSEIFIFATKLHHGSRIQCSAQNEGYENLPLQPAYTKLNVQYAPIVKMQVKPPFDRRVLLEKDVVTIRCEAEGRPDNFTWSWMINDSIIEGAKTEQYQVTLMRSLINVTVACIATSFAEGRDQTVLNFNYAPQFVNPNPIIYAGATGEGLRMRCVADGNPLPDIEWRFAASAPSASFNVDASAASVPLVGGALVGRGELLERERIHENDFGVYICTARAPGFPPASKKIILAKKSAPRILPAEPVYAAIGATARLPCTISAVPLPRPEGLFWFRRDVALQPSSHRKFSIKEYLGGVVYVMSFTHVQSTDFGFYNCSALNAYGMDSRTMELRRDDELSISSLSGILSALVAAVFLALLIFFCCRRWQFKRAQVKGGFMANTGSQRKRDMMVNSCGYMQKNSLPQIMNLEDKDEALCHQSSSGSTEADTFTRYQMLSTLVRNNADHANSPSGTYSPTNRSTMVNKHCIATMRSFSPVCKYALIDGNGKQIPVCTNVVTFAPASSSAQGMEDYRTIPIGCYVNVPGEFVQSPMEQIGVVAAPDVSSDSNIIVNTQVTRV